ncbi:MAG: RusA family crossover junction endodeoxyribonuclease [Longibaculum sp.]
MEFIIYGEPKAKGRPRFVNRGKFVSTYTPKETLNYENLVKISFDSQIEDKYVIQGEIKATIKAFFSIPKSTSKKKEKSMLEGNIKPTKKPDCDNIAKTILDALNGIAYRDDSQIVELNVEKYYSHEPRVEVEVLEI